MKLTRIEPKKTFVPFDITIETEEEAREFWHRYNTAPAIIVEASSRNKEEMKKLLYDGDNQPWILIDRELKRQGIDP